MQGTEWNGLNWQPHVSKRWHFEHGGKIFILYADTKEKAQDAIREFLVRENRSELLVPPEPQESGYYDRSKNVIVDAKDGPHTIEDARKVF